MVMAWLKTQKLKVVLALMMLIAVISILNYVPSSQKSVQYQNDFNKIVSVKNTVHRMSFENQHSPTVPNMTYNNSTPLVIILLAYLHTGSTFTGSILQQHPNTFYQYEQLRSLEIDFRDEGVIKYLDGSERRLKRGNGSHGRLIDTELGAEAVYNLGTCRHENLDNGTLGRWWHGCTTIEYRATGEYYDCLQRRKGVDGFVSPSTIIIKRCLPKLTRKCFGTRIRVAKYIRASMAIVERVLQKIDNIKVIQLVRDPRAMLDSQVRHNELESRHPSNFIVNTEEMCTRMADDFELLQTLSQRYPGKVKTLRYEDLVEDPIERVRDMYKFLGLNFTESDQAFVTKKTIRSKHKSKAWRGHIRQKQIITIDGLCGSVYSSFGYLQIPKLKNVKNEFNQTFLNRSELPQSDLFL